MEEIQEINEVIFSALKGEKNNDISNIHIGEFVEIPNQFGCFKRNERWYMYETDEKNVCTFNGPFTTKGIIYACAMRLRIGKELKEYRFTEEEFQVYLHNHFHTYEEIDAFKN